MLQTSHSQSFVFTDGEDHSYQQFSSGYKKWFFHSNFDSFTKNQPPWYFLHKCTYMFPLLQSQSSEILLMKDSVGCQEITLLIFQYASGSLKSCDSTQSSVLSQPRASVLLMCSSHFDSLPSQECTFQLEHSSQVCSCLGWVQISECHASKNRKNLK